MTFDEVLLREIKLEERLERRLEGKLELQEEVIGNLIVKYGFTNLKIAEITDIPIKLVRKVRAKLMRKQNVG